MAYDIIIKVSAIRDIKDLDPSVSRQILGGIVKFFSQNPIQSSPLRGKFKGYYKFRIGDFRVIYTITKSQTIAIIRIALRKNVYR